MTAVDVISAGFAEISRAIASLNQSGESYARVLDAVSIAGPQLTKTFGLDPSSVGTHST